MKKGYAAVVAGLILLTGLIGIGHAASVSWDMFYSAPGSVAVSAPTGSVTMSAGGVHWYKVPLPGGNYPPLPLLVTSDQNAGYGVNKQHHFDIMHNDYTIPKDIHWTYDAQAGTATLPDGVSHNTAQRYDINDDLAGVQTGFNTASSNTTRNFLPIGIGDITVAADLTNLPTWDNVNYDFSIPGAANSSDPTYYAWHVVGGVQIDKITLDDPLNPLAQSHEIVAELFLDSLILQGTGQTFLSDSLSFSPIVNDNTYYSLLVQLSGELVVQNVSGVSVSAVIPAPLGVGTWSNPLDAPVVLNAVVDQQVVPIPGTLVLLLSGVGGLTLVRRRLSLKS